MISDDVVTGIALYVAFAILAVWAALVLWSWHDMGGRSRSTSLRFLAALLVALLNVPGLFVYLALRPRATLAEAYERSLEEEILLQGIEDKLACPSCMARTQPDWQLCPACQVHLRRPCNRCGNALELDWERCPYCAARQAGNESDDRALAPRRFRPAGAARTSAASPARERDEEGVQAT